MMPYLLDTNHSSGVFKKLPPIITRLEAAASADYFIPLPSLGELWFMMHNSARIQQNASALLRMLEGFPFAPFDESAAEEYGRLKAHLRRAGRMIPDVDLQIAAIAIAGDLTLLTADAHFGHVPGLRHENWLTP